MILTERLYLTEDRSRAVKEGDLRAAYLLGIPGKTIPDALAKKLGLIPEPEAVVAKVSTRDPEPSVREPIVVNRDFENPRRRGRPPRAH